jgi:signal transduction histidine kinase
VSTLADFFDRHLDEIVERWIDQMVAGPPPPASTDRAKLENAIRGFFAELILALRAEFDDSEYSFERTPSLAAAEHGAQRFGLGTKLSTLIREYGSLRDVMFQVMDDYGGHASEREFRVLSKLLVGASSDAAEQFSSDRDEQIAKQSAQHLAFLAHELRNPLASARLTLTIMKRHNEIGPDSKLAATLERNLTRLEKLIDDSLLETKLKLAVPVVHERVEIGALMDEVGAESNTEIDARRLSFRVAGDVGASVVLDRRLLRSILSNLIRNAIKFSRSGGTIELRVKHANTCITLEVQDECGGLPEGDAETLFEPYVQRGHDRTGFGLGLALTRQAVDALGGRIRVQDLPGRGCVFAVDLPLAAEDQRQPTLH